MSRACDASGAAVRPSGPSRNSCAGPDDKVSLVGECSLVGQMSINDELAITGHILRWAPEKLKAGDPY